MSALDSQRVVATTSKPSAPEPSVSDLYAAGRYVDVLCGDVGRTLVTEFVDQYFPAYRNTDEGRVQVDGIETTRNADQRLVVGLASFDAFLQSNVTGPVLAGSEKIEDIFCQSLRHVNLHSEENHDRASVLKRLRNACHSRLETDGVAPYPHVPLVELFCLAEYIFSPAANPGSEDNLVLFANTGTTNKKLSIPWICLRIDTWHYRLLAQPSLGPGATVLRGGWYDVPTLSERMLAGIGRVRATVAKAGDSQEVWALRAEDLGAGGADWTRDERAECLIEMSNVYIMLGMEEEARTALREAVSASGLEYILTGALGKRTKWQEKEISQLVVLAKSRDDDGADDRDRELENADEKNPEARPNAIPLDDDTLLEIVAYSVGKPSSLPSVHTAATVPPALANISPSSQPQLRPLDQAILLADATIRDAFSPADALTAAEVAPYAARVLADGSSNWQVYTQALLVRSRIETRRSRTIERGILQMQAVVDQVVVDVGEEVDRPRLWDRGGSGGEPEKREADGNGNEGESKGTSVPTITVAVTDDTSSPSSLTPKTTSFLPAPGPTESAPAPARLAHVHALASPPRWQLESELAYAWAHVGSLVSALDIFKRLRLWAEVALCLASAAAADDDEGRGAGGDGRARGILRWRLFRRQSDSEAHDRGDALGDEDPDEDIDPSADPCNLLPATFSGRLRNPPPPSAARLLCILGDLESEPAHYQKAWDLSGRRFARAQRALGEHHILKREFEAARAAYRLATGANRTNAELWGRLGEVCLRLGKFGEAASAFRRAVGATGEHGLNGEDAKTWSNLGSALWSLWKEAAEKQAGDLKTVEVVKSSDGEGEHTEDEDLSALLARALGAFKRGASIAHSNWRIWDNVLTLAARTKPPAWADMVQATRSIAKIRPTEEGLDANVLSMMVEKCLRIHDDTDTREQREGPRSDGNAGSMRKMPPRGTIQRNIIDLFEDVVVPLITSRPELWEVVSRERAWRGDFAGAIDAAERAWRAEMGHGTPSGSLSVGAAGEPTWLVDEKAWTAMVGRTEELVRALEMWGPEAEGRGGATEVGDDNEGRGEGVGGGTRWKTRAKMAVRSVMGKARERWEGSEGWGVVEGLMERVG